MALLEINDLVKYFKTHSGYLHAVDHVSMKIEAGETMGVVGESGCGKSTLGKAVLRLVKPTSGDVFFEGENIAKLKEKQFEPYIKKMQMIFQDPFGSLDPRMSVSQIIAEPFAIFPDLCPKKEMNDRVKDLMETVGLAQRFANSYPHELDGGRRQRIGIARALAMDPKFIVCDEPVSALDVSIQAQVLNLLMDLQEERGLSYMFITHDMSVVKHISKNITVMYLGQAVEISPTKELFSNTLHPYTQALLSAIPVPNLDHKRDKIILRGEITSPINPKPGCRFAPRCPYASDECFSTDPEMREVCPGHFVACHKVK